MAALWRCGEQGRARVSRRRDDVTSETGNVDDEGLGRASQQSAWRSRSRRTVWSGKIGGSPVAGGEEVEAV